MLDYLSTKSIDDVGWLDLNKDWLQHEEWKELDLVDDTRYKLDSSFEHQSSYYLQENDMESRKSL